MNTYSITEIVGSENWEHEITAASYVVNDGFLYLSGEDGKPVATFAPGHWSSVVKQEETEETEKDGEPGSADDGCLADEPLGSYGRIGAWIR